MNTTEVSRSTGATLRQLQWWDEIGLISPVQGVHERIYDHYEVLQAKLVVSLRNKGLRLDQCRKILNSRHLKNDLQFGDVICICSTTLRLQRIRTDNLAATALNVMNFAINFPEPVIVVSL